MTKYKHTAIDLFSGCGGLTEGLKQAGFRVIGAIENESIAVETFRANHRKVKVWQKDIRELPVSHVMRELNLVKGQLDLLAGCPPCQGFSAMRTLNGKKRIVDVRNDLIFDYLRFVNVLRPKVVMLENVPGLASDKRFKEFQKKLYSFGYKFIQSEIINAVNYGVPQNRRRLILLASRIEPINFPEVDEAITSVRTALNGLPKAGKSGDPLHDVLEQRSEKIKKLIASIPKDGGSRSSLPHSQQLECHKKVDGFKDVYGRMAWDRPAPTITSGCFNPSKGRFIHPQLDRNITLREAALLQTFPRKYRFSMKKGKSAVALMIGNALPPELIKRKGKKIVSYLNENYAQG